MIATYLVDGVGLDDTAGRWRLEKATKLPAVASRRVAHLELPFRDGSIAVRQGMGLGHVGLSVAALDTARTGGAHDLTTLADRYASVAALLSQARQLTWRPGAGPDRHVEVAEVVLAEPDLRNRRGVVVEAAVSVQPFWWTDTVLVDEQPLTAGAITFPKFDGSTAPIVDGVLRVKGPAASVIVTTGGTGLTYGQPLTATDYLFVDLDSREAWVTTDPTGQTGRTPAVVDYPAGGWLTLWPTAEAVTLTAAPTGQTSASTIQLTGRRWFL